MKQLMARQCHSPTGDSWDPFTLIYQSLLVQSRMLGLKSILLSVLSNELQVTPETPPTFLVAGGQDRLVPAENSLMFFQALRERGVAFSELYFVSHGGHGYQTPDEWHGLAESWLRRLGVLPVEDGEKSWPAQFDKGAWGRKTPE